MILFWQQTAAVCVLFCMLPLTSVVHADDMGATNPTQQENLRPGTSDWKLTKPALHREIEGYASVTSVNRGQQIKFYVHTQDPSYIAIYRMGWYAGAGARLVHGPVTRRGIIQPMPVMDIETGLIECAWQDGVGVWTISMFQLCWSPG